MSACFRCCIGRRKVKEVSDESLKVQVQDLVFDSKKFPKMASVFIPNSPPPDQWVKPPVSVPSSPKCQPISPDQSDRSKEPQLGLELHNRNTATPLLVAGLRRCFTGAADGDESASTTSDCRFTIRSPGILSPTKLNPSGLSIYVDSAQVEPTIAEDNISQTRRKTYSDDPFAPPTPGLVNLSFRFSSASRNHDSAGIDELPDETRACFRSTPLSLLSGPIALPEDLPEVDGVGATSASPNDKPRCHRQPTSSLPSSLQLSQDWSTAELFLAHTSQENAGPTRVSLSPSELDSQSEAFMMIEAQDKDRPSLVKRISQNSVGKSSGNKAPTVPENHVSATKTPLPGLPVTPSTRELQFPTNSDSHQTISTDSSIYVSARGPD